MDLRSYLTETGQTVSGFAARVGRSHAVISRLIHRRSKPSLDLANKIFAVTEGQVTPQDWDGTPGNGAGLPRYSAKSRAPSAGGKAA